MKRPQRPGADAKAPPPATGGWGCPHDDRGTCLRRARPCEPGVEGCVLEGKIAPGS